MLLLLACTAPDSSAPTHDSAAPADSGTAETGDTTPTATYADPPEAWAEALDTLGKEVKRAVLQKGSGSGGQYAVWYEGAIVASGTFGTIDPDSDVAPDADTLYEIGSDTKKITALALLKEAERGTLSLDDSVATLLPELSLANDPGWAAATTLRQLLSHQSGLYDYSPWLDEPGDDALQARMNGDFASGELINFPPGLAFMYSNPNYSVAGRILEVVTQKSWSDAVMDNVLQPLGLTRSVAREADTDDNTAIGNGYTASVDTWSFDAFGADYGWEFGRVPLEAHPDPGFLRPAASVWSTAEEQARLFGFVIDGDSSVLADEWRSELTAPQAQLYPGWDGYDYGFGVFTQTGYHIDDAWFDDPLWYHCGATLSYTSALYALPAHRLVVTVLSNGYGDAADEAAVTFLNTVAGVASTASYSAEIVPPVLDLETYAGTYVDPNQVGRLIVTPDGDTLTLSAPDLDAAGIAYGATITPFSESVLVIDIAGAGVYTFVQDGEDKWLVGRSFSALASASAGPPAPVQVDPRRFLAQRASPRTW